MKPTVSVVHLIWMPYGIQLFKDFVDAYQLFNAGYQHELVLLFNGISDEKEATDYHKYIDNCHIKYQTFYYKSGQDLQAYRWVASQLFSDYILFLNSYSKVRAANWLQLFMQAQQNTNAGIIGATGSWQSYYSTILSNNKWVWTKDLTVPENFRKYKLLLKTFFLWRWYFKPFPNPHIRTNAFLMNRELFLIIKYKNPKTKFDAYRIESGKKSVTQQVLRKGLRVLVLDKFGMTFEPLLWNTAKVFWCCKQEHLLISDNQTETYFQADSTTKKFLEKLAWGVN